MILQNIPQAPVQHVRLVGNRDPLMSCITILNPNPRENPFAAAQENKKENALRSLFVFGDP